MENIQVIGIDPAPSKMSTLFDGKEFKELGYKDLKKELQSLKDQKDSKVLICWDAPLFHSNDEYLDLTESPYYTRTIEAFFTRKNGVTLPSGISVLGYAGCPHWSITQALTGYPLMHSFFKGFNPPFELVFDKNRVTKSIVEVHPALAIWIWCNDKKPKINDWHYKGPKKVKKTFTTIIEILKRKEIIDITEINTDDELDAYIAWKLGKDWVKGNNVKILGNNETGSFLLPYEECIFKKFRSYIQSKL